MGGRHHSRKRLRPSSEREIYEAGPNEKRVKDQFSHGTSVELGTMEDREASPEKPLPSVSQILRVKGWRGALCDLLDLHGDVTDHDIFGQMQDAFAELRTLRNAAPRAQLSPTGQIVYKVICHMEDTEFLYVNPPRIVPGDNDNGHLQGKHHISNLALYLERHKEISFLAYRTLECCVPHFQSPSEDGYESGADSTPNFLKFFTGECIRIIREELTAALLSIALEALKDIPHPEFVTFKAEDDADAEFEDGIASPYLWWFHRRGEINQAYCRLTEPMHSHFAALHDYIDDSMSDEWNKVDELLRQGKVTQEYLSYLFVPNSILISESEGERLQELKGSYAMGWLEANHTFSNPYSKQKFFASISVAHWDFDGRFKQITGTLALSKLPTSVANESFEILRLPLYPATYANPGVEDSLRQRGRMFWKCRRRNYVYSRSFPDDDIRRSADSRFMVDFWAYRQMHAGAGHPGPYGDTTPEDEQDLPEMGDVFFMCLPTKIFGFNMQKKEWTKLDVEFLEDVEWNEEAFEQLVIDDSTKELVEAVVTHQLQEEGETDLIRGKGNGLFILLHGGPGTGKTLTAESVAEIAKKPLYRVTCGDIVFLRVLEYYDGIMILTSNRVGIFDEAFKSRIQLTLHYKNLDQWQRLRIWENFLTRMEKLEQRHKARNDNGVKVPNSLQFGLDTQEIRNHVEELAAANLNGREIRNALSTARQLAVHRKQPLGYQHVKRVIEETSKFDKYLRQLRQGFSADEIRHRTGER
ncbi:ATPase [Colletotrichum salicis]|uniref:ATPase n=1 Tax=Colletotrichum salicis TaxID=1209931 RepID=A0A135UKS8_9PEZI|nr:ATPase [Colletotrichum salicis]